MPISRFRTALQFNVGDFQFYPAADHDITALRPIPMGSEEAHRLRSLRWACIASTGLEARDLFDSAVVAFTVSLDWEDFHSFRHHNQDLDLLRQLSALAEKPLVL